MKFKFEDVNEWFDEICFKGLNHIQLTDTELIFVEAYRNLFLSATLLEEEKENNLIDFLDSIIDD